MKNLNRRTFLKGVAGAAGACAAFNISGTRAGAAPIGANDRLRVAVCGLNGRGKKHISAYLGEENVEIAWLVDPDRRLLDARKEDILNRAGRQYDIRTTTDVREALEDKNLDAISVATPNHWHSLMVILAAQAGKHVYVEKPASHDIAEGRVAVEAAKKYGIVVQHGTQQRSSSGRASMIKAIQSGKYGRLKVSHGFACKARGSIGFEEPSAPPDWLDWNLWRGPAVIDRYHNNYVHYDWHWFWKTGNGELNNQGTHQLDVAYWALDPAMTHPVRAMALGGRFRWKDQGETPNTLFGLAEYPNGQWVFFNVRNLNHEGYRHQIENRFYFEDGGKIVGDTYISPDGTEEKVKGEPVEITGGGAFGSFVRAARAGKPEMSNCDMYTAHLSCTAGHVMNNSYRLGEKVPFNKKAGRFGDNKIAYEQFMELHELMRDGAGVPEDEAEYVVGPWLEFDPKTERFTGEHADAANRLASDPHSKEFAVPAPDKV